METIECYLARKSREIALLNSYLASPLNLPRVASPGMAIEQKFRLAASIKAERSVQNWALTETARPAPQCATAGAFEFRYDYQRADLHVHGPPIYRTLFTPRADVVQQTIYTGSGMSAMAALLTALLRLRKSVEVLVPDGCYSETRELIESFGGQFRILPLEHRRILRRPTNGITRVVLLDSSVCNGFSGFHGIPTRDIDLVIFDTTCFWRASERIQRVANWALASKLPLALVRSHAKLDCLGIEYGRLGSVVFAAPLHGILSGRLAWITDLTAQTSDSVRLFGVAPTTANFPPFTGDRQFERLSAARVAAIIRNNRRMARLLAVELSNTPVVALYQHGLYMTLMPDDDLSKQAARGVAAELCGELVSSRLPVLHAGSFGFDFVAIEWFADSLTRRNVIRVAASDIPFFLINEIAEGIARWCKLYKLTRKISTRAMCIPNTVT